MSKLLELKTQKASCTFIFYFYYFFILRTCALALEITVLKIVSFASSFCVCFLQIHLKYFILGKRFHA